MRICSSFVGIIPYIQSSYKQNKFNLLREQSEGYSKLTTELTSSLGPPHSTSTGYPVESTEAIEARARPTWERALGLIGYFDLDPNRALDIILDVFSIHLATHHAFFISLLSFYHASQPSPQTDYQTLNDSSELEHVQLERPQFNHGAHVNHIPHHPHIPNLNVPAAPSSSAKPEESQVSQVSPPPSAREPITFSLIMFSEDSAAEGAFLIKVHNMSI